MNQEKSWVLTNLSDFTGLLDQALEGEGLSFDNRLFYLGHLATPSDCPNPVKRV